MADLHPSIDIKIKRANQHISELQVAIDGFIKTKPYSVTRYIDSEQCPTYVLAGIEPVALEIQAITGDTIQNLRTALDYLACLLWSRTNTGECKVSFPVADSAAIYEAESPGKIKGMRQDAIDAISALQPYKGGAGVLLWQLHKLSIIDKHRLPITVVGGNLGVHLPSLYPEQFTKEEQANPWIVGLNFKCPLKVNDILFRDQPYRELKENMDFPFFIALGEPSVVQCQPIVPLLKNLSQVVRDLCIGFGPLFT